MKRSGYTILRANTDGRHLTYTVKPRSWWNRGAVAKHTISTAVFAKEQYRP